MSSQTSKQAPNIGATPQPATESAEMAAWRYARQLTILEAVTRQLNSVEPPEQFLPQILRQLCQSFSYEAALIYRLSPDGRRLLLNPPVEKPVEPNRGWRTEITLADKHIVSDTFRRQTITYLPLTNGVAEAVPPSAHQLHSEICIPMPGGVFHIKSARPNAFDEVETRFLTSLANLFGTIIKDNQALGQEQAPPEPVLSGAKQSDLTSDDPSLTVLGYAYDRTEIQTDVALSPAAQQLLTPTDHLAALAEPVDSAELVRPIRLYGETIGVLGVEAIAGESWSAEDISLIEEVSDQVALAIENARLIQQTQAQTKELSFLFAASQQLSETADLSSIYEILIDQIISYLQADRCGVALFDKIGTTISGVVEKRRMPDRRIVAHTEFWREALQTEPALQRLKANPQPLIEKIDAEPSELTPRLRRQREQHISILATFPLIVRNQFIGVLEVGHRGHRPYPKNEIQLAQAIIAQVTVAIENAQQFQKTEEALAETRKLYQISRALVETNNLEEIFQVVLDNVKDFGIDRVSLSLLEPTTANDAVEPAVKIVASWDRESDQILPVGAKISADMFSLVTAFAEPPFNPLISEDLGDLDHQDPRMDEAFRRLMYEGLGAVTMFSTPMFLGTEYKGVLSISTRSPHTYDEQEQRVYQTLADQAIIAIENRRLFETVRHERDQAELLIRMDQKLSQASTISEAQNIILGLSSELEADFAEVYITDRRDVSNLVTNIPERRGLSIPSVEALAQSGLSPALEVEALESQKIVAQPRHELGLEGHLWPSLESIQAFISLPFAAKHSSLRGVLTFLHTDLEALSPQRVSMLESVAAQAASIIENLWLLEQTGTALSETELLYDAARDFNKAQHPEELLRVLADSVVARDSLTDIGIDNMAIALITESSQAELLQELVISARWSRPKQPHPLSETVMTREHYPFISEISSHEPQFFSYTTLPAATQKLLEERFGQARSIMAVPLRAGYNWLGVLFLTSTQAKFHFKHNLINQIITLAGQMAVVIQNLRLIEETQQTLYNSEILSQLGQDLLVADTTEVIYDLGLKAIAATEPTQSAAIIRYRHLANTIEAHIAASWYNSRQPAANLKTEDYPTYDPKMIALLEPGQSLSVPNLEAETRLSANFKQFMLARGIQSFLAIPLLVNRRTDGFLLVSQLQPKPFSADLVRLFEDVARQMSGALDNRHLFEEAQYRASLLQTAAEVSQAATGYLDLNTLLTESVNLIKERFGFYHVSIFLVDDYKMNAVVKASTGEIGQKMLEMGHKLAIGGRSIVGTATAAQKAHIALDVGEDGVHFKNPLLPDTRSEMALPLVARAELIGALDVQSVERGAFSQTDITILQTMADQLANAIAAALAAQETQDTLEHMRRLNEYYLREAWGKFIRERSAITGYQLSEDGFIELLGELQPEISEAMAERQPFIVPMEPGRESESIEKLPLNAKDAGENILDLRLATLAEPETNSPVKLITPLSLQNEVVIGALDFELTRQSPLWEDDTLEIVEAVTSQAAQAIEAARLFAQTQIAREEAETLYRLGRTLVTAENETIMYQAVLEGLLNTLGLGQGGVLFFDQGRTTGHLVALFENGKPVEAGQVYPIAGNASYELLIEGKKPVAIEDVHTDPRLEAVREVYHTMKMESLLLVPIVINDEVIGALGADSVGQKHHFTAWEINLASAIADQFSIVLQNRRLLEETHRRAIQLQATTDVGQVATSILDQEQMLERAVELIKDRFGFYHIQVFLIDSKNRTARLHKATGEAGQALLSRGYKVAIGGADIIGQATHQRRAIVIRRDTNPKEFERSPYREYLPLSAAELAIPLRVGDSLTGVLDFHSTDQGAFTPEELPILETLAAQLAIATENARAFREQQESAERLKEIDKLKTQFLANMSHELRTPLNSIIGFSRVILKGIDGPLTELQKTDLTSIHNSGQHLLGLINNILDLSKIEAGKMELNFEEVEVEPIIKSVMATAIALVKDKPVALHQEIPQNLPLLWADPTRIRQIILNLISNACKFTDEGSVTLRAICDAKELRISVADTGVGIPEDKLSSIFEEFTQVDASTTRKVGGTGLGLPISRHFVDMHKGKIWVESVPGQGATFTFTLPLAKHESSRQDGDENSTMNNNGRAAGKVIVAIDDDPGVIQLYERYLEPQGYAVVGISSSKDIVPQVKEVGPTAILLDVLMPDRDGWSVIRDLKEDPDTAAIPVIICSIVSDKKRGFSLGAVDYMTKPITENDLLRALDRLEQREDRVKKVLVIDDEADDILLIRRMLESQPNYSVIEARNGKDGLSLAKKEPPDLIILDLNMPEIDGFSVVEALKNSGITRSIPIVIVSAKDLTAQEEEFLTGHVELFLRKGIFTETELLEDVQRALVHIHQKVTLNL